MTAPPDAGAAHDAGPGARERYIPSPLDGVPYVTREVEPIGGVIKERNADFLVEEQPMYAPCGHGEHCYIFVEKDGLSTGDLISVVARHFRVREGAIGYAGMKDKYAVTRQVLSVHTPGRSVDDVPMLEHDRVRVLWADMHTNKLRVGHLKGNRFSIKIRGVEGLAAVRAKRAIDLLSERGVPNLFGEQRFGYHQDNHEIGRRLLLGEYEGALDLLLGPDGAEPEDSSMPGRLLYARGEFAEARAALPASMRHERAALRALSRGASAVDAVNAMDSMQLRFLISAFQSAVFNRVAAERLERGLFGRFVAGDVACKLRNGALFDVDESLAGDPDLARRLGAFEVSPSGPLWGTRTKPASLEVAQWEERALRDTGVTVEAIDGLADELGVPASGARRAIRVALGDPEVEGGVDEHGHYVRCAFELPSGSFATLVMREVMKTGLLRSRESPADADDGARAAGP